MIGIIENVGCQVKRSANLMYINKGLLLLFWPFHLIMTKPKRGNIFNAVGRQLCM